MNKKVNNLKASVDLTQAEGFYDLFVSVSEGVTLRVILEDEGLDYLESTIKGIREHQKWVKDARKRNSCNKKEKGVSSR